MAVFNSPAGTSTPGATCQEPGLAATHRPVFALGRQVRVVSGSWDGLAPWLF
jgi:hypothetical protein